MFTLSEILRGKPNVQHDDIKILRSFVEYRNDADKMNYIIYEMEIKDRDGKPIHIFKAVKFYRIIKLPDALKESTAMMDIQSQVLASFWENDIKFVSIIARIEKCGSDSAIGLLQLYGVQGVAKTIEEAKRIADADFQGLTSALQGSYRTMEFRLLNYKEAEWLRTKMANMKHLQVVRGIPFAHSNASERSSKGFGGTDTNPNSEETTEQFAAGLADKEFITLTLSSPIEYEVLESWLEQTSKKQTYWNSIMQGSTSLSAGINIPIVFAANLGSSLGMSDGVSDSTSTGHSTSKGQSYSVSESVSQSHGFSHGTSLTSSESFGDSSGISHNEGQSLNQSLGHTQGTSYGYSENNGYGTSHSNSLGDSTGISHSSSSSTSVSDSVGSSDGSGASFGKSSGESFSSSNGISKGISHGTSSSGSRGINVGVSIVGANASESSGESNGASFGSSASQSHGSTNSTSQGVSFNHSDSHSKSTSASIGEGIGTSNSKSQSEGWGESYSSGRGQSYGASSSDSQSNSKGLSTGDGWSKGLSYGQSRGVSQSETESESVSTSHGVSKGSTVGESDSWSRGIGRSSSVSSGMSQGLSSSMGMGASLGIGKSYQFIDAEVQNIVELLEFQKLRLKKSINGGTGAFFVDMYIATETEEAKNAAKTAAKFAWYSADAMICPLQVLDLDDEENEHMLYHFNAFSPCIKREIDKFGQLESYKYTTILNSQELTAYTHILRLSDGGIYADIQNIPELAVPSEMSGEIYMGKILSGYRWTVETGYKTAFEYRIPGDALMHGLFCGGSRSGKSVTALRFTAELANHVRRGPNKKRLRIVAMDPKMDWRKLARFVEPERFRIYSMGDPDFCPFKLNPLKVPHGVDPEFHLDTLIDVFCRAYGLGVRSVTILLDTLKTLFDKEGVFDTRDPEEITRRSGRITLATAYEFLNAKKENKEFGRDKSDAVDKVLDRLGRYAWKNGVLYKLYCQPDGMSIDELLGGDDVVVLESGKVQSNNMAFIFGFITASIYMFAKYCPGNFLNDEQFETVLVIEEANRVLTGSDGDSAGGIQGQSIFEEMLDQAAGLGLFCLCITQQPALMPNSILANCGLVFAGKMKLTDDISAILAALGRDEKFDDRPIKKFFPLCPIGWFICQMTRSFDYKDSAPVLVAIDRLDVEQPSDNELRELMYMREIKQQIQNYENEFK